MSELVISMPKSTLRFAVVKGIEYVEVSALQAWLYKSALATTEPNARRAFEMAAETISGGEES